MIHGYHASSHFHAIQIVHSQICAPLVLIGKKSKTSGLTAVLVPAVLFKDSFHILSMPLSDDDCWRGTKCPTVLLLIRGLSGHLLLENVCKAELLRVMIARWSKSLYTLQG